MADVVRYQTPVFRASFPELFEPKGFGSDNTKPKYSVSAVWDPSKFNDKEKKLWQVILKAMDAESKSKFKKAFKDLPANFKKGIRDGAERADMEGYGDNTKFANLTTLMPPGVIDRDRQKISIENGNTDDVYPGCYMRATVTVYSYDNKGKGIALGLMNVQKVADGERLDSRTDAAEDFDDEVDSRWLEEDESSVDEEFLD